MIILIGYELPDKIFQDIFAEDMHGEDACEEVIDAAISNDERYHVYHLPDSAGDAMHDALTKVFRDAYPRQDSDVENKFRGEK